MFQALQLPKDCYENLGFAPDIKDKIKNGEPLWNQVSVHADEDEDDAEIDESDKKKSKGPSVDEKMLMTMFGDGMYHIIPAFYRMLIYLRKTKRDFQILFRTFGIDLEPITYEFNSFCSGTHPCFNGQNGTPLIKFNGADGTQDLRIQNPEQMGLYYRFSNELTEAKLLTGTFKRKFNELHDLKE